MMVTICVIPEPVSFVMLQALTAIMDRDKPIKVGGNSDGTHFMMPDITETERQAWENIIRGLIVVKE